jgi:hypothetical protein
MKKIVLLSVVASTMIMAGGDIVPVAAPAAPVEVSGWDFSGQAVVYYQTNDNLGISGLTFGDLFEQEASGADAGIQLKAVNKDVVAGIGAGFTVNGLSTLNLENSIVSNVAQSTGNVGSYLGGTDDLNDITDGGWIGEAYLTYGIANTSIKAGRQTLPLSLSPFAYSENWNVFENTFDAALIVNTDISNTTLVGAWVAGANYNTWGVHNVAAFGHIGVNGNPFATQHNLTSFNSLNDDSGIFMLTAQNKSFENLTLTGSWYYASEMFVDDLNILWGDAAYNADVFGVALQGGAIMSDAFVDDTTAFGVKVTGAFAGVNLMGAYSTVADGVMFQVGGETSALYTTTVYDQINGTFGNLNENKFVLGADIDALGGNFAAAFAGSSNDNADYTEFDLVYGAKVTEDLGLTVAYVYADIDAVDSTNVVRLVANYNF